MKDAMPGWMSVACNQCGAVNTERCADLRGKKGTRLLFIDSPHKDRLQRWRLVKENKETT
jgi:hypothetical protein